MAIDSSSNGSIIHGSCCKLGLASSQRSENPSLSADVPRHNSVHRFLSADAALRVNASAHYSLNAAGGGFKIRPTGTTAGIIRQVEYYLSTA